MQSARPKRSPQKKGGGSKAMASGGASHDWQKAKVGHLKKGDDFLAFIADEEPELAARWGSEWTRLPERESTMCEVYGHLATCSSSRRT